MCLSEQVHLPRPDPARHGPGVTHLGAVPPGDGNLDLSEAAPRSPISLKATELFHRLCILPKLVSKRVNLCLCLGRTFAEILPTNEAGASLQVALAFLLKVSYSWHSPENPKSSHCLQLSFPSTSTPSGFSPLLIFCGISDMPHSHPTL